MFLNLCKSSTSFITKKGKAYTIDHSVARPIGGSKFEIKLTPTAINIKNVIFITYETCIDKDGKLYIKEDYGNKYNVVNVSDVVKVVNDRNRRLILNKEGQVYLLGHNEDEVNNGIISVSNIPKLISINSKVTDLGCGQHHYGLVTESEQVYMCGRNEKGQLGLGDNEIRKIPTVTNLENVKMIACGYEHTVFLTKDGKVYSCGR